MLTDRLSKDGFNDAATAIMTTDTYKKQLSLEFTIDNKK